MIPVHDLISIGNQEDCDKYAKDVSTVHACKFPCYKSMVCYDGHLPDSSPYYLSLPLRGDLYLNIVDSHKPIFPIELFRKFYAWAVKPLRNGSQLLIHCNQGRSRSPSLALLLMAKELHVIRNDSFKDAAADFLKLYPDYAPSRGIAMVLEHRWHSLEIPEDVKEAD